VLSSEGHENEIYNIANEVHYSFQDVADMLSALAGKKVSYTEPAPGSYTDSLRAAGFPEHVAQIATAFSTAMRNGDFDLPGDALKNLLGRKPTDLKVYLQQAYFDSVTKHN
jgi:NAD(P)H dehydrogenase (quinone)